jgi:hypothetical protein
MRCGAFVQLWTMRYGRGRIAAFTDSTIFSNFSAFEPGKKELWMGMIEWLNHRSPPLDFRWPLAALGAALLSAGLWLARRVEGAWLVLLTSGLLAWSGSVVAIDYHHRISMPEPRPQANKPRMVTVTLDQTVSRPELPKGGFISGTQSPMGLGIFERWILRLGYFLVRRDQDVFQGDLVVFGRPEGEITDSFREGLLRYVANGGKALVIDWPDPEAAAESDAPPAPSPEAPERPRQSGNSTANDLLKPFGLRVQHDKAVIGPLTNFEGWPTLPVFPRSDATLPRSAVVAGGQPFAWVNGQPVGATVSYGNQGGTVTVVGYGWRFGDAQMGMTGDFDPNEEEIEARVEAKTLEDLRNVYEWEYGMLRAIIEGKPLGQAKTPPEKPFVRKKAPKKGAKP